MNSLSIKEWWTYAEHLAANHPGILHVPDTHVAFSRWEFPELIGANFNDLQSPCLIAEAPESDGVDNSSNNLLARRHIAFTIAKRVEVGGTIAERMDAEQECETIAMQVLARFRHERIHRGGQVFADVKMNGWEGVRLSPFLPDGWVGYRIMVPVFVNDIRLKHDNENWLDDIGTALLYDLSGMSCANLNHITLGLTTTQRLSCILPGYDFADAATLDALTDQQETDLIAAFGGSGGGVGIAALRDGDGDLLFNTNVPAGTTVNITAPGVSVEMQDGNGNNLSGPTIHLAGSTQVLIAPSVDVTANAEPVTQALAGSTLDLLVEDEDGNALPITINGNIITVTMPEVIKRYADLATANAATGVTPTAHQFVLIEDTGHVIPGNGTANVPALIAANKFLLGVKETEKGFNVGFEGAPESNSIQLNAPE